MRTERAARAVLTRERARPRTRRARPAPTRHRRRVSQPPAAAQHNRRRVSMGTARLISREPQGQRSSQPEPPTIRPSSGDRDSSGNAADAGKRSQRKIPATKMRCALSDEDQPPLDCVDRNPTPRRCMQTACSESRKSASPSGPRWGPPRRSDGYSGIQAMEQIGCHQVPRWDLPVEASPPPSGGRHAASPIRSPLGTSP
jgi:hypothetical protein